MDLAVLHWVALRAVFRPVPHAGHDMKHVASFAVLYLRTKVGELEPSHVPSIIEAHWTSIALQYARHLNA